MTSLCSKAVCGGAGAGPHLQQLAAAGSLGRALVVGLGGGGLPVFLQRHCGLCVDVVELDDVVVQLACDHFGFHPSDELQVAMAEPNDIALPC